MRKFKLFVLLLGIFSLFGLHNVKAAPEAAEVKVSYYLDGDIQGSVTTITTLNVGDPVSLTSPSISGTFLFWTVNGAVRRDLTETPIIKASAKLELKAYYISSSKVAAVFLDTNLQMKSAQFLAVADSLVVPAEPVKPKSTFAGWVSMDNYELGTPDKNPAKPTENTYFVAKYTADLAAKYTVVIDGVPQEVTVNQVVTATTDKLNPVWKDEAGNIVGYGSPFKFAVLDNINITANAGESLTSPQVLLRGPFNLRDGYVSYVGTLPSGVEIVEYGFEYVKSGITYTVQSNVFNGETNEFLMSFLNNGKSDFRAYVKYKVASEVQTVYSEPSTTYVLINSRTGLTGSGYAPLSVAEEHGSWSGSANQSEYGIGTRASDNVTFTANTGYHIEAVRVVVYSSSGTARNVKVDGQTIAEGIVTANSPFDSGKVLLSGTEVTSVTFVPSGALQYLSVTVYVKPLIPNEARDDLEAISFEPEYSVATNLTLPTTGTVNSSNIEWSSTHPEIISTTGTMVLPELTTEVTLTAVANKDTDTYTKKYFINVIGIRNTLVAQLNGLEALPSTATSNITLAETTDNGTSITWSSDKPGVISNTGVVNRPVGADETVIMTASITSGGFTETRNFTVIVLQQGAAAPETFTETFAGSTIGASYSSGTYTGVNGIVWSYVDSRNQGDYPIETDGIMLRGKKGGSKPYSASLTATFTDGITEFSFQYRKAFTGSTIRRYKVDVTCNGVTTTYDVPEFGGGTGAQTDVYTFTQVLNLTGTVTIKIYADSDGQATIDNITITTKPS